MMVDYDLDQDGLPAMLVVTLAEYRELVSNATKAEVFEKETWRLSARVRELEDILNKMSQSGESSTLG